MRLPLFLLGCAALWGSGTAGAQALNNASLNGKYYFVELLVDAPEGQAAAARNLGGAITFDGSGLFSYTGKLAVGSGTPAATGGTGAYSVGASGAVTLTNPIRNALQVRAWLSADQAVLLGISIEASDNSYDIFVAIRAPASVVSAALLNGAYTAASLVCPNGTVTAMNSALVSLAPNGGGQFTRVTVAGHAADQAGRNVSQEINNATYNINPDGTGSASFGSASSLLSGDREIFVSEDGNYVLGYSTAAGARDIFLAIRNFSASATAAAFDGSYRVAELSIDGSSFGAAGGTLKAFGSGRVLFSERWRLDGRALDYSGLNSYSVSSDGTGALGPQTAQDWNNMALGAAAGGSGAPRANAVLGAQIGKLNTLTSQYGIFFGVRAPSLTGTGVFLDPDGVVNGASFAPAPHPISPGAIVSLFGSSLSAAQAGAATLPLPLALGGVSVAVNGTAAPLFFVSPGQVNIQVPFGLKGNSATIQLSGTGVRSSEITVPLSPTSPGIFSYDDGQSPSRGVVLHSDFSLVTAQKPARPGETVILYLTGLGEMSPSVSSGAGNPDSPAVALDSQINVLFGGKPALSLPFAGGAPRFAGLNQINVVIPWTVADGPNVPVAVSTGNAFTDLVEIPIAR